MNSSKIIKIIMNLKTKSIFSFISKQMIIIHSKILFMKIKGNIIFII
jgi:hypothetical protein